MSHTYEKALHLGLGAILASLIVASGAVSCSDGSEADEGAGGSTANTGGSPGSAVGTDVAVCPAARKSGFALARPALPGGSYIAGFSVVLSMLFPSAKRSRRPKFIMRLL